MKIVYVGLKPVKADNVAATGLLWTRGQIHDVEDEEKAAKLLEHPLIWANADAGYELLDELKPVDPSPRVQVVPVGKDVPSHWEPIVIPVEADVFAGVQNGDLKAVFMTEDEGTKFEQWKLDLAGQLDPAPLELGPLPWNRETTPEEDAIREAQPKPEFNPGPEPKDKRTREWRDWAARMAKAA